MSFIKTTPGEVKQTFNDAGECIDQHFEGDENHVQFNTNDFQSLDIDPNDLPLAGREYFAFDMVPPNIADRLESLLKDNGLDSDDAMTVTDAIFDLFDVSKDALDCDIDEIKLLELAQEQLIDLDHETFLEIANSLVGTKYTMDQVHWTE